MTDSHVLEFRLRRDIHWQSSREDNAMQTCWIATDPLTRRIFRCGEHELQLLRWLDNHSTYVELANTFHATFAPATIRPEKIHELILKCQQAGILIPIRNGEPSELANTRDSSESIATAIASHPSRQDQRHRSNQPHWIHSLSRGVAGAMSKFLQVQVSLGSPDRWLTRLAPKFSYLYSGAAVCFWFAALAIVAVLIVLRLDDLWNELPSIESLRSPAALVGYGALFVITRAIHELGHAIVCKRMGASCRDAGIFVSFGFACPYVDITDAWRVSNRWSRIAVAMAGMYTEAIAATLAGAIWLSSHPGWLHQTALQTLLVCTVITLLFNANPLMKYDGYFVLCDLVKMQNLRERSFASLDALLGGKKVEESWTVSILLALYFFASTVNRGLLICGLAGMVYFVACQWQLAGLGFGIIVFYGCCWTVTNMTAWTLANQGIATKDSANRRVIALGWTAVCLLLAWAVNMPLPWRAYSAGSFYVGQRVPVYASLPGRVVAHRLETGHDRVDSEAMLLELSNRSLEKGVLELETRLARLNQQLETLHRVAYLDDRAVASIPSVTTQQTLVASQLGKKRTEVAGLRVTAPSSGRFEPAIAAPADSPENPSALAMGLPPGPRPLGQQPWLSAENLGRWVDRGTVIGWIVQDSLPYVECTLSEEQRIGIRIGTEARICLGQSTADVMIGRVVKLAKMSQSIEPRSAKSGKPQEILAMAYRLQIELDSPRLWTNYNNGSAEIVFVKPNQSLLHVATDHWLRNMKVR